MGKLRTKSAEYGIAEVAGGEADGPLLPGWEEGWSEEHQCHFYWHKATKQSSWERPAVPDVTNVPVIPPGMSRPKVATPMTPLVNKPGTSMTPITPSSSTKPATLINLR